MMIVQRRIELCTFYPSVMVGSLSDSLSFFSQILCCRYWLIESNDGSGLATQRFYVVPKAILNDAREENYFVAYEAGQYSDLSSVRVMVSDMELGPPENYENMLREIVSCEF